MGSVLFYELENHTHNYIHTYMDILIHLAIKCHRCVKGIKYFHLSETLTTVVLNAKLLWHHCQNETNLLLSYALD